MSYGKQLLAPTNAATAPKLTKVRGEDGRIDVLHSHFLVAVFVRVAASA